MDNADTPSGSRNTLRQPFIDTANALASLYKQAVTAERDARDAGARAAYRHIMEWAARKSRAAERVTPAELMNFISAELAALPQHPPPSQPSQPTRHDPGPAPTPMLPSPPHPPASHVSAPPVAYVPRDDPLVSDIRKLHVNPRKRQRVDISDSFVSACRNADSANIIFAADGYALRSRDASDSVPFFPADPGTRLPSTQAPRRESREGTLSSVTPNEFSARRGKNAKNHIYDKLRKK